MIINCISSNFISEATDSKLKDTVKYFVLFLKNYEVINPLVGSAYKCYDLANRFGSLPTLHQLPKDFLKKFHSD